ncbi:MULTISPECIES: apotyrosinase chaperone MelC1 [Streptomyces]|uniref:Tyrosinase n=1 Tax=Streptomyces cadmiisoli TaxID=2184053 RepID=A0A2Z4J7R1_9ACTN|nr:MULTISPECIES: tyrosinase cofactor [Streptomyces]AWW41181.1 tyrosinase [Streptomyces cadmiisoli]KOV53954.1 tyrosinase [Streptomyces sp. AS58]
MPELSRRRALAAGAALTAAAGTLSIAPGMAATARRHGTPDPEAFDEVYNGRLIQGRPVARAGRHHGGAGYEVHIDGAELHMMRNADGSWISVVNHYAPVPTPRAAARAAVDELRGARLVPFPAAG